MQPYDPHWIRGEHPLDRLQRLALIATLGSAALLLGALGFQYLGGLAPCPLCIDQRWAHVVAVVAGALILFRPIRWLALVGFLGAAGSAAIGLYHAGIEQKWWQGPTTCTAPSPTGADAGALLDQILETPVVLCDQIAWSFAGISMAGWNAILSLILALVWLRAYASSSASQ